MMHFVRPRLGLFALFVLGVTRSAFGIDPCPTTPQTFEITTTAGATELATALNCSGGGTFDVLWEGRVVVDETFALTDGSVVTISGVGSGSIVDGGGTTQLFTVSDATLELSEIGLENGSGTDGNADISGGNGGAIWVSGPDSAVFCTGATSFNSNTANTGGAVSVKNGAVVSWTGGTSFHGNTASQVFGGAVSVENGSSVSWDGRTNFTGNVASIRGGALYANEGIVVFAGETFFADNVARTGGGALLATFSDVSWSDRMSFKNNTLNTARESGGTVHVEDSVISWDGETSFYGGSGGVGGALHVTRSRAVWKGETTFCDNVVELRGGALSVEFSSEVSWTGKTLFCNNTVDENFIGGGTGGAIHVSDSTVSWNGTTTFTDNTAVTGGALYGDDGAGMIWSGATAYEKNAASANGGAVALAGDVLLDLTTAGTSLSLTGNTAGIAGGGMYQSNVGKGLTWDSVSFISNSALNGGAVYSVGTGAETEGKTTYPSVFANCLFRGNVAEVSGGAMESAAGNDEFTNSTFEGNMAGELGGGLRVAGTTTLTGCDFVGNGAGGEGPAVANVGTITMVNTSFTDNNLICTSGAFLNFTIEGTTEDAETDYYNSVCDGCEECTGDCPSVGGSGTQRCIAALENTVSNGTDGVSGVSITLETLQIDAGYWRSMKNSSTILPCWNEDACLGGLTDSENYCDDAYRGPYCAICAKGYAPTLAYTCSKCSEGEGIAFAVVALLVAVAAVVAAIFHLVSKHQEETNSRFVRLTKALPVQGLKTVVVAWQILTQFDAVANVTYAGVYGQFLDGISSIISFDLGLVLSAGCMVTTDFHDRLLISTLGPLVALGVVAVCFKVAKRRNQGSGEALQIARRKHFSMALLITFLVYSSVSSTVFRVFDCETLDGGTDYLRADYTIECTDAKHKAFQVYGVFMILLYPIGIPVLYAVVLFRNRALVIDMRHRSEQRSAALQVTSSLWKPYRPSRYYYEVVECARRVTLTGVVVFIYPNTAAQVAVTLVLAFVFVMVSESLVPYATTQDAWLSRVGHTVVFLSMFQALVLKVDVSDESSESQQVFGGVLLAANICMVAAVIAEAAMVVCSFCGRGDASPKEAVEPWVRNAASNQNVVEKWDTMEADGPPPFTGKVPELLA